MIRWINLSSHHHLLKISNVSTLFLCVFLLTCKNLKRALEEWKENRKQHSVGGAGTLVEDALPVWLSLLFSWMDVYIAYLLTKNKNKQTLISSEIKRRKARSCTFTRESAYHWPWREREREQLGERMVISQQRSRLVERRAEVDRERERDEREEQHGIQKN